MTTETSKSATPVAPAGRTVSQARLLVVDDNPAVHDHFRMILNDPGYESDGELEELESALFAAPANSNDHIEFQIDSAHQGAQAVDMVREALETGTPYSVAFVDVRMPPGLDGIETLSRIWEIDPRVQAVICTAFSDHSWEDMVRSLGHNDGLLVLRKPFDPIEALQLAHALTRKWLLARQLEAQLKTLEAAVISRTRDLEQTNQRLQSEITQRARAENDMRHLATHDALTGLPNRILLNDRLGTALSRAQRKKSLVAVLLLDLDQFKDINDSLGHAAGDELLREIAKRLTRQVRDCDTVARLGGDEFVVLLEDLTQPEDAAVVATRILSHCGAPTTVLGHAVHTPPSIGIAIYPSDCPDAGSLLKSADLAMYQAKQAGGASYAYFAQGMLAASIEKLKLREELGNAVQRQEFDLWYQPVVELGSGRIAAMEALLRWRHPQLGLVPPMKFIPAAERSGLIVPIGRWVLETACKQLVAWQREGHSALSVAVNVSAAQLRSRDFVSTVAHALTASELTPSHLEIEITETTVMEDFDHARAMITTIANMGVRIAIDDFGAGYSSLLRLKTLPIHTLKIDRFFVKNIVDDPRDAAIVAAVVAMAHSLGISVVAEGIEQRDQLESLRNLDLQRGSTRTCERVQGYLFSKPLPADAASTLLSDYVARGASPNWTGTE